MLKSLFFFSCTARDGTQGLYHMLGKHSAMEPLPKSSNFYSFQNNSCQIALTDSETPEVCTDSTMNGELSRPAKVPHTTL